MPLLRRIEIYLRASRTSPSQFGLRAARDPKFVFELRRGRVVRPPLQAKILSYLRRAEKALGEAPCPRRR